MNIKKLVYQFLTLVVGVFLWELMQNLFGRLEIAIPVLIWGAILAQIGAYLPYFDDVRNGEDCE